MIYIGIDPGLTGAIACLDGTGKVLLCEDTPTLKVRRGKKNKTEYQLTAMRQLLIRCKRYDTDLLAKASLEFAHPRPGQGVNAPFSSGLGYGMWQGLLAGVKIPYQFVHPVTWKKYFQLPSGSDKQASIIKAQQTIPGSANYLTLKKHDGRAEAILMAEYLRVTSK